MFLWLLGCPKPVHVDTGEDTDISEETGLVDAEVFEGASPCRSPIQVTVLWVHDGDTATVEHGTVHETVRFVGIDTPEMDFGGSNPDCWAQQATDRATELLENEVVWLGFDATCTDAYDRTLAYITLDGEFINRQMVREGHAWAFPFEPNTTFASNFQTAEQQASAEGAGLWGNCDY